MERLDQDIRELRGEVRELRGELRSEVYGLRSELRGEIFALRRHGMVATVALAAAIIGTGILT